MFSEVETEESSSPNTSDDAHSISSVNSVISNSDRNTNNQVNLQNTYVRQSSVDGYGVFAKRNFNKGDIVMIWSYNYNIMTESEYHTEQKNNNINIIRTGARLVNDIFLCTESRIEDHVNHSFNPNMLYHCGICFAKCDIKVDDELFVNYNYVLARNDEYAFYDENKKLVDGFSGKDALIDSTKELCQILNIKLQ